MSDMQPVETVDEEGFTPAPVAAAPCKIEVLLWSVAQNVVSGVDDMEGASEAEGVIEERAPEGVAVLDWVVDAGRSMK
jgi:hypothetical protein